MTQTFPKCRLTRFLYTFHNRSLPIQNLFYPSTYLEDRCIFVYTKQSQIIQNERETKMNNKKKTYKSELPLRTNPSAAHALLRTPPDKKGDRSTSRRGCCVLNDGVRVYVSCGAVARRLKAPLRATNSHRNDNGDATTQPTNPYQPASQPAGEPSS